MSSLSGWNERAEQAAYNAYDEISDRAYNLVMGGVVLYGLGLNFLMCLFLGDVISAINPIAFLIAYFVCCIAGITISRKSDNPLVSFLGYNLVVLPIGLVVSSCVEGYGGVSSAIVGEAFYYTMLITAIMVLAGCLFPTFFDRIGGVLFACLLGIVLCSLLSFFFPIGGNGLSLFAAAIFALYIGYDYHRAQQFPRTVDNAVDCALDIYLDIINLFLRILEILGRSSGSGKRGRN